MKTEEGIELNCKDGIEVSLMRWSNTTEWVLESPSSPLSPKSDARKWGWQVTKLGMRDPPT